MANIAHKSAEMPHTTKKKTDKDEGENANVNEKYINRCIQRGHSRDILISVRSERKRIYKIGIRSYQACQGTERQRRKTVLHCL